MPTKATLLDKMVGVFSPRAAVRRVAWRHEFEMMAGGYDAARDSRFRTHHAYGRSMPIDEDHLIGPWDREKTRLECHDLYRNNEVVRGAVNRFRDYSVWLGICPQATTSDKSINKIYENWWNQVYSPTCDYRQRQGTDMVTFQGLNIIHRCIDGDLGYVFMKNGQLMPIEGERIRTPSKLQSDSRIVEGVKSTKGGILTGFYACKRTKAGTVDLANFDFLKKDNFRHLVKPTRIDQIRGIPDLAPCVNKLRDYDETDQYVLNKVKSDAQNLYNRKNQSGGARNDMPRGSYTKTDSDSKDKQRVMRTEWGNVWQDGELEAIGSKTPNSEYVSYLKHELQMIAACLGIPYEYLMLIFVEGSFSAQKAAMLHAQHTFKDWHKWVIDSFLQPVWNWRIAKAIKNRELPKAPVDDKGVSEWFKVKWSLPHYGWVDPEKQAKADKERFNQGSTSMTSIIRNQGGDRDDTFDEKADDIDAAILRAEKLNEEHPGANVSWRDMIQTAIPGQLPSNDSTTAEDESDEEREERLEREKDGAE